MPSMKPFILLAILVMGLAGIGTAAITTLAAQEQPICNVTITATPSLNLRAGPSTAEPVVARAQPGSTWRIFEVLYDDISPRRADEWVRVQLADGRFVWGATYHNNISLADYDISQNCLDVRFPSPSPIPGGTPQPTAAPSETCTVTMSVGVVVRAAPGTSSVRVGSLRSGLSITVQRVQADSRYVWAQHSSGWSAIYNRAASAWWVSASAAEGQRCLAVAGWSGTGLGAPPG